MTQDPKVSAPADVADAQTVTDEQLWNEIEAEDTAAAEPPEGEAAADNSDEPEVPEAAEAGGEENAGEADSIDPKALQAQIERLNHALSSEKGRSAAGWRRVQELQQKIEAAEKSAAGRRPDDADLTKRREARDKARQEYGDIVGPVIDQVESLEKRLSDISERETAEAAASRRELEAILDAEEQAFLKEHPDGLDVIVANRSVFDLWIEDQPKRLRDLYAQNKDAIVDGAGAAIVVASFKQAIAQGGDAPAKEDTRLTNRRQRQLDGARTTRGTAAVTTSSVPDPNSDDAQAHWDYFDRRERVKR